MAIVSLNTIKNWFKTGFIPTQAQFWDTWDSLRHKSEKVPVADVEGIDQLLSAKADKAVVDDHLTNVNAHANLFNSKEDKNKKGAASGYAPLDEAIKISAQYLNIVNDLFNGGANSLLSAEQGKVLQTQINNINVLLQSDNVNLDNVQELVDAIETIQMSLSTILVNDLTTGGTTKALTAEMGKTLKSQFDDHKTDANAHPELVTQAKFIQVGQRMIFKHPTNTNPDHKYNQESNDFIMGFVGNSWISGYYLSGDEEDLQNYDVATSA